MRTEIALPMFLAGVIGGAQPAPARYTHVVVLPLEVSYGTVMPAELRQALVQRVVEQLNLQFVEVTSDGNSLDRGRTLKLTMAVAQFNQPGRDVRTVGLSSGDMSLRIRARFIDAATCALIAEGDAETKVVTGSRDGDSLAITQDIAQQVSTIARRAGDHPPVSVSSRCDPDDGVTALTTRSMAWPSTLKKLMDDAAADDVTAQRTLAIRFANGDGVPASVPIAMKWWHRAATNGDAIAQTELAVRYEMGWGVPIDTSASTKWLLKAVAQRDANALAVMGVRYEKGLGVPRDLNEAVRHYREAADAGHARAMCYLGDMYLGGLGVHANHTDAYRWHVAAIAAGDERCGTHANASGMSLSPEMRAQTELEGRALARQRSR